MKEIKALLVISVVILIGAAMYQFWATRYNTKIIEIEKNLAVKDFYLKSLDMEEARLAAFEERIGALEKRLTKEKPKQAEQINCLLCHELEQTKGFHYVDRIIKIQDKKNLRRVICINCHGPPANSTQIPDPSQPYPSDNSHPHRVHQTKLATGEMKCETCHVYKGEFRYPKPKEGQLLVCELCHANGNFITIHIEGKIVEDAAMDANWIKESSKKLWCTNCHMGEIVGIHKRATAKLGLIK